MLLPSPPSLTQPTAKTPRPRSDFQSSRRLLVSSPAAPGRGSPPATAQGQIFGSSCRPSPRGRVRVSRRPIPGALGVGLVADGDDQAGAAVPLPDGRRQESWRRCTTQTPLLHSQPASNALLEFSFEIYT